MIGLYDAMAGRLRVTGLFSLVEVGHSPDAAEVYAIGAGVGALVCPLVETAAPIEAAAMIVSQQVIERVGVVLNMAFPSGFSEFEPAKQGALATLRGWQPHPDASGPLIYAGGRTLLYDIAEDGGAWRYLLEFNVARQDRVQHQP